MPLVRIDEILNAPAHQPVVASFNICSLEMLEGVVLAAEQTRTSVLVGFAERHKKIVDPWAIAGAVHARLERCPVPIGFHFDHATSLAGVQMGIEMGCTSVMIDGSMLSLDENIELTRAVVAMARPRGIAVEGELGGIGGIEGEVAGGTDDVLYTRPEHAERFMGETDVDLLAIAIGTVHGLYRKPPQLRFDILDDIRRRVSAPLVLHGSTGLPDDDVCRLVNEGIRKVNVFTELSVAAADKLRENLKGPMGQQGVTDASAGVREAVCEAAERWIVHLNQSKESARV